MEAHEPPMPLPSRSWSLAGGALVPGRASAWTYGVLLVLATGVGAWLRMLGVGDWALWVDEAFTWRDATMPLEQFVRADRVWYSLPFQLLRGLLRLGWIGEDPRSLRLPFLIVGALTVPLLALCGRRLVGAWPALLAAWLLALHPWHVFWSQSARGYALVVAAAVVAANRADAYFADKRLRDLFLLGIVLVVAGTSHPTAWLLALAVVGFVVLRRVPAWRARWVALLLLAGCTFAMALPYVGSWLPFEAFRKSKHDVSLLHFVQTSAYYFRPTMLLAAAAGALTAASVLGVARTLLLACFSLVPFLVLSAVGFKFAKATARYALCALPALLWLAAFASVQLASVARRWQGSRGFGMAAAALVSALLLGEQVVALVGYYTEQRGQRAAYDQAVDVLHRRASGRPLRVLTVAKPILLYYLRPGSYADDVPEQFAKNQVWPIEDWMFGPGIGEDKQPIHAPGAAAHLQWHHDRAAVDGALLGVVFTLPELVEHDPLGEFRRELEQRFELVRYLPCWVGPKDESVHVYVERRR